MMSDSHKKRRASSRSGFTLTELAIVMGLMSLILGAIWTVVGNVRELQKENDAATELQTISQNILTLMQGRSFTSPAVKNDMTTNMISAQTIPSTYTTSASNVSNPWGPTTGLKAWVDATSNTFRLSFYNTTQQGCIALLLNGTSCQAGVVGCPTQIVVNGASGAYNNATASNSCKPNVTACGGATASTLGWQDLNPGSAVTLCGQNTYTNNLGGSVEFVYSTQ